MIRSFSFHAFFLRLLLSGLLLIAASGQPKAADTLRVGVAGSPPFVMDSAGGGGIAVEIWQALATDAGWNYRTEDFSDVPAALDALVAGKVDLVAGPVSITADRARRVSFTQPYYASGYSILSRTDAAGLWARVSPFFSRRFFWAVCVFLFILAGVGMLLWLAERRDNAAQFPHEMARGIANGMWCAIVTMSTTGYGDKAPVTFWGRVVAASWMVISIIFATTMVAGIASTLTLTGLGTGVISRVDQLRGRPVAVVKGSPGEEFVRRYGARDLYIETLAEGYELLKSGKVDAVFYDRPQLLYFLQGHPDDDISVSVADYLSSGYGFALPLGSPLLKQLNLGILEMQASGSTRSIVAGWLGTGGR